MQRMISGIVAPLLFLGMLATPSAHATPYVGPHCDPSARDYFWSMCKDLPNNDAECSEFGDMQACQQDITDYWRQQRELTPTPN